MKLLLPDIADVRAISDFTQRLFETTLDDLVNWDLAGQVCKSMFEKYEMEAAGNVYCLSIDLHRLMLIYREKENAGLFVFDKGDSLLYTFPQKNMIDDLYKIVDKKHKHKTGFRANFVNELHDARKSMYEFAYSMTQNRDMAEDLLMESTCRMLEKKDTFFSGNILNWAKVIMKNIFMNDLRKMMHEKVFLDENALYSFSPDEIPPESSLSIKDIHEKIKRLDKKYNVPLTMFLEGYKYTEIAEILDMPQNVIKARIYQAREELKAVLRE